MHCETNQISRNWTILHEGRRFYVNYTESDGQTLGLLNRDNWEVLEDTDDSTEELNVYVFKEDTPEQREKAQENALLKDKVIRFCIENWDNEFIQEVEKQMGEQLELLRAP